MAGVRPSEEAIQRITDMTDENTKKRIKIKPLLAVAACFILLAAGIFGGNALSTKINAVKLDNPLTAKAYESASKGTGSVSNKLRYPTDYNEIIADFDNSGAHYHGGVDFPCPNDSPVYAAADGTVILAEELYNDYGYYIIIDHGNGLSTLYAHNSELLVEAGEKVSVGQVIARSGSTGNSTGPHCHFEVRINGERVNPAEYL